MSAPSDPDDVVVLAIVTALEEGERGLTRRPLQSVNNKKGARRPDPGRDPEDPPQQVALLEGTASATPSDLPSRSPVAALGILAPSRIGCLDDVRI